MAQVEGEGTGVAVDFATTSWSGTWLNIELPGSERAMIETTGVTDSGPDRTFVAAVMNDAQSIEGVMLWGADATGTDGAATTGPPRNEDPEVITFTLPARLGSGTIIFTGFLTKCGPITLEIGSIMSMACTIQRTGAVTGTANWTWSAA